VPILWRINCQWVGEIIDLLPRDIALDGDHDHEISKKGLPLSWQRGLARSYCPDFLEFCILLIMHFKEYCDSIADKLQAQLKGYSYGERFRIDTQRIFEEAAAPRESGTDILSTSAFPCRA
jgi:hypothetical protein